MVIEIGLIRPCECTLDQLAPPRWPALIKIDVEGAEVDVIEGASHWLNPRNYFLIEVHQEKYLDSLHSDFTLTAPMLSTARLLAVAIAKKSSSKKQRQKLSKAGDFSHRAHV
jgi:hypothetical protein